ncbi:hypothetical protein C0V70_09700 [Bacteriovorax stolpii]|uniref:HYDIN/VesB/CFA65-like Ig-like domain-containing protein n=1 Tax=Bacteriovorax stolpii TaxID=960 RepID=A0A2K9NS79_BACTC|nr:hypothetical protein [Bacteriovorax stolpii]AUN98373.1 hypothetical protein C0V70_09700 [Bacteriovorax stolpii]TDP51006.1 hypothetical protein C8D79_3745 [Bacteriovorax stolpii]BDT28491.1 hypothetical protein BHI3_19570 [Bacteriovorax sp. HI3]
MKKLLLACSLLLSLPVFAKTNVQGNIELSSEKGVERHYYHFGVQRVHSYSSIAYRVTNTGTTPLNMIRATIGGTNYGASTNCRTLQPGERCSFRIDYRPFFEGYHTGRFTLSFDQDSHIVVDVSGQAVR